MAQVQLKDGTQLHFGTAREAKAFLASPEEFRAGYAAGQRDASETLFELLRAAQKMGILTPEQGAALRQLHNP